MADKNDGEYSQSENEIIMDAYKKIKSVTNYKKSSCNNLDKIKPSQEYEDNFNNLDGTFNDVVSNYKNEYVRYKMYLAEKDFFNGGQNTMSGYTVDDNVFSPLLHKLDRDIFDDEMQSLPSFGGFNIWRKAFMKNKDKIENSIDSDERTKMKKKIIDNYTDSYNIVEKSPSSFGWGDGKPINPSETVVSINELELQLVNLQQQLGTYKLNLENDIHTLQKCITSVSEQIDNYTTENEKLQKRVSSIVGSKTIGEGRLYDAQLIYNQYYLGNWIIGLIVVYLIYKNINYFMKNQETINKNFNDIKEKSATFTETLGNKIKDKDNFNV